MVCLSLTRIAQWRNANWHTSRFLPSDDKARMSPKAESLETALICIEAKSMSHINGDGDELSSSKSDDAAAELTQTSCIENRLLSRK